MMPGKAVTAAVALRKSRRSVLVGCFILTSLITFFGLRRRPRGAVDRMTNQRAPAGDFSEWLRSTEASLRSGQSGADVPCGACRGCWRSFMFIHIKPEETRTIQRIQ